MLNIEKYKKKIVKAGGVSVFCVSKGRIFPCRYVQCNECEFHDQEECDIKKTNWLCSEYKEPEIDWDNDIDWRRVPADTNVLVKDKDCENWVPRRFAVYLPRVEYKYQAFCVFSGLRGIAVRENAESLNGWRYCKLANAEDIEKYRKR